jgi:hypothetical protein
MQLRRILTVLLAVSLLAPAAAAYATPEDRAPTNPSPAIESAPAEDQPATANDESSGTADEDESAAGNDSAEEYVRLYIEDEYRHLELKPGESETFSVTIENGDETDVEITPDVFVPELGNQRPVKPDWVTIEPGDVTLEPDEEETFDVTVDVPEDAELARYQGTIALTDRTVSYENRPPRPVHSAGFSLTVYKEPIVRITQGDYLHARAQAGDTIERTITIENTGDQSVPLNPTLDIDSNRHYHGGDRQQLQRSWIDIDAPSQVAAGETVDVTVTIDVPGNAARGHYDTEFSLGLKDPHRRDDNQYWQRIDLSLEVWEQPDEPFETTVQIEDETETVSVTLDAGRNYRRGASDVEAPTFDVVFVAPNGTVVPPEKVTRTQSGSVNLADDDPHALEQGAYSADGERHTVTYEVDSPESGEWTVRIMPHNAMYFGYEITQHTATDE